MKRFLLLLFCASVLAQCAVRYKPVNPETVAYDGLEENDDLRFAYRYDVLKYRRNFKLARYQEDLGAMVIAVQITNKTSRPLNIARDMDLFTEEGEYPYTMAGGKAIKELSQPVGPYLFYGLIVYARFDCEDVGRDCGVSHVIPVGLGFAAFNMIRAHKANRALEKEFKQYDLENLEIAPGQTVYGIVALELEEPGFPRLKLELR